MFSTKKLKSSKIKIRENSANDSRVAHEQKFRKKLTFAFRDIANAF